MMNCFRCLKPIEFELKPDAPCPYCRWDNPRHTPDTDSKYLVFLALTHRIDEADLVDQPSWTASQGSPYRLNPTSREFAMIEHGDQFLIDQTCWRVTGRNTEKEILFVRGWQRALAKDGSRVETAVHENLAEEIRKYEQKLDAAEAEDKRVQAALEQARKTGEYPADIVDYMTQEDWDSLSVEQRRILEDRYEQTME